MIPDHPVIRNLEATGQPETWPEKPVFICSNCDADIFEGDSYWDIMGERYCKDCIEDFEQTAYKINEWEE